MAIISILILIVFVVSALLLMTVVLIQDDQGGGIGGMFGGGSGSPFGARTGNVLTRLTSVLAVIFLVSAFSLAWMNRTPDSGNVIGRARAERLRGIEHTDWWVEAPAPVLLSEEAPVTEESAALTEGETPPAEAPAESAAPVAAEGEGATPTANAENTQAEAPASTAGGS